MRRFRAAYLDKLIAVVALAALAAENQDLPSKAAWTKATDHIPPLIPILILVAGLFSLGPIGGHVERKLTERRTKVQREIFTELGKLITAYGAAIDDADHKQVGLHIWKITHPRNAWFRARLQRIGTYRLGGELTLRQFEPTKGEGVVGLCWKHNREYDLDVAALSRKMRDKAEFISYAKQHGQDAVMGMTWEQFEGVRHRGSVFASPIRGRREKFRGCVSLDFPDKHAKLKNSDAPKILNELAERMSARDFEEM